MRSMLWAVGAVLLIGCSRPGEPAAARARRLAWAAVELADEDGMVRLKARLTLMRAGKPAVPHLILALGSDEPLARFEAAAALSGMRAVAGAEAVPVLADALRDPDPMIRANCLLVLRSIGPAAADAVPAVRAALHDDDSFVCSAAAFALAAIQQDEAIPTLTEALHWPRVGLHAADALQTLGPNARFPAPEVRAPAEPRSLPRGPNSPRNF